LLLAFASQKIVHVGMSWNAKPTVHNVRNEMSDFVVRLRRKNKDCLTRQGTQEGATTEKDEVFKKGQEKNNYTGTACSKTLPASIKEKETHWTEVW